MMESCSGRRFCSILGKAERNTVWIDTMGLVHLPLCNAAPSRKRHIFWLQPTSHWGSNVHMMRDSESTSDSKVNFFHIAKCVQKMSNSVVYKASKFSLRRSWKVFWSKKIISDFRQHLRPICNDRLKITPTVWPLSKHHHHQVELYTKQPNFF